MVSDRMKKTGTSATAVIADRVTQMKAEGQKILSFNIGEPDFDTPQRIIEAGYEAMKNGYTRYAPVRGIAPLRREIARKLKEENGISYDPDQICVTTGAKQAIYSAILATCGAGDEVLIPTPCWVSYEDMVKLADAKPILIPPGKDYQLNLDAIRSAITDRTRMIIINTPNNPTGAVYTEDSLRALADLAIRHDFYILSDEVYEKLVFGKEHVSAASFSEEAKEHCITVNGFSKAFAMTGWRLGYVAAPFDVSRAITALQSNSITSTVTFVQYAAITALRECADTVEAMRKEFAKRRDYAYERMSRMKGITCTRPDGAFYLMPDVTSFFGKTANGKQIQNAADFCEYILEEAKIATVPGDAFEMPGTVRIAYPVSMEQIRDGMDALEKALEKLN